MVTGKDVLRVGKRVIRAGIVYNNMGHMDKISAPSIKRFRDC